MDNFIQCLVKAYLEKIEKADPNRNDFQDQLEELSGVSQSTISRLFNNLSRGPSIKLIDWILENSENGQTPESLAKLLIK